MGRIFLSAGHSVDDPGASAGGVTEAEEMMLTRDALAEVLGERRIAFLVVPDTISLAGTIAWINARSVAGDVAVELHADSSRNLAASGCSAYYVAGNQRRRQEAEALLRSLIPWVDALNNRGAHPDTDANVGQLGFCRRVRIPSILVELGFITNDGDRERIRSQRRAYAQGLADGLSDWSRQSRREDTTRGDPLRITIDGEVRRAISGVVLDGNAFVPVELDPAIDVLDRTGAVAHGGQIFIPAVHLESQGFRVSVDLAAGTVALMRRADHSGLIMGHGRKSVDELTAFLTENNAHVDARFAGVAEHYVQEAADEGVDHDIAFCQMCLETGYLTFRGDVDPSQFNMAGIGAVGGGAAGASFPTLQIGVRAQIQHLKAYASTAPLHHARVDPRFNLVARGSATTVQQLAGRWAVGSDYGTQILSILNRLYS